MITLSVNILRRKMSISFFSSWLLRDKQSKQLDKKTIESLSPRRKNSKENPILERFLADQRSFVSSPRAELRSDLKLLPRAGHPAKSPTVSSLSSSTAPSFLNTSDEMDRQEDWYQEHQERLCSAQKLTDIPGLTFADYLWATSASRKMKMEAIYI